METLARGGIAGLVATAPMTLTIAAGQALGLMGTPPPVEITENVAERAGEEPDRESPVFQVSWLAAHAGYGAACGALYALVRPALPRSDLAAGLVFGGAVWGVSYLGLLPALDLFPPAQEDSPSRQGVMIAAHAVYGASLAACERSLRPAEDG